MASKKNDFYVYSTLSANVDYTGYKQGGGDLPIVDGYVRIGGHANVANKHFDTPRGVVTGISSDELDFLKSHPVFQLHEKNGFVVVEKSNEDIEKVVADMEGREPSAPLVPEDFEAEGKEAPKSGGRKA